MKRSRRLAALLLLVVSLSALPLFSCSHSGHPQAGTAPPEVTFGGPILPSSLAVLGASTLMPFYNECMKRATKESCKLDPYCPDSEKYFAVVDGDQAGPSVPDFRVGFCLASPEWKKRSETCRTKATEFATQMMKNELEHPSKLTQNYPHPPLVHEVSQVAIEGILCPTLTMKVMDRSNGKVLIQEFRSSSSGEERAR